jgi:PBP1b-binding outer membrane lipoprotein LpoB
MKKVIFALALVATLTVGCNNGATSKVNGTDSTTVQVDSVSVDSLKVDSIGDGTLQVKPVEPTTGAEAVK